MSKTINLLDITPNQPSMFKKDWVEINDDVRGT